MKNMIKVSKLFNRKIAQVTSEVYRKFVQLNNMAQSLAIDVYDEMGDSFTSSAQMLSQKCLLAADKIYRKGMLSDEMRSVLSSIGSILNQLMVNPDATQNAKKELSTFKSVLSSIIPVDVPAQSPLESTLKRMKKFQESEQRQGDSKVKKLDDDTQDMSYPEDQVSTQIDDEGPNMSVDTTWTPPPFRSGYSPNGSYVIPPGEWNAELSKSFKK